MKAMKASTTHPVSMCSREGCAVQYRRKSRFAHDATSALLSPHHNDVEHLLAAAVSSNASILASLAISFTEHQQLRWIVGPS